MCPVLAGHSPGIRRRRAKPAKPGRLTWDPESNHYTKLKPINPPFRPKTLYSVQTACSRRVYKEHGICSRVFKFTCELYTRSDEVFTMQAEDGNDEKMSGAPEASSAEAHDCICHLSDSCKASVHYTGVPEIIIEATGSVII